MPLFRFRFEGDVVDREVQVDNVGVMGSFVVTKKGNVTELIPSALFESATIIEGIDEDEDGDS